MADTGVNVDLDALRAKYDEIAVIDEKLDSVGGESGKQRALANQISAETESLWKKQSDQIVTALSKIEDMKQLVGTVSGIRKALDESFKAKIDEFLTAEVESRKSDGPTVSEDEIAAFSAERKTLVDQYRALKQILDLFGQDTSTVPEPKKRTGSRGKRGPRVLTNYAFSIDGKERSVNQNSLSSIANTVAPDGWKVADLKAWLVEQGLDLQNPPAEFSYTLPNGKVLSAVQYQAEDDDEEVSDEDE